MSKMEEQGRSGHDAAPESRPLSKKSGVSILVVLLIVAAIIAVAGILPRLRARTTLRDQTNSLAAPDVLALPPVQGQPSSDVTLPGAITAFTDSPIYARTNGYLQKWYFDIGAHVKKGQLLAVISTPEVDQQLLQAKADLATSEATAHNAQQNSTRYQDLLKSDAVSQQETETFQSQAAATSSSVKSAQANVQRLHELQSFQRIYAPFDGVITARSIDVGQLIDQGSGHELFHLASVGTLRVYVNVPQNYARSAKPGVIADLTLTEYPGRKFPGKLVRTSNAIDPNSRTLLAEFDVDNRKGELLPGAYAQVHFKSQTEGPALMIPVSALIFRAEGLHVAIVTDGNKARLVPVVLGRDDGRLVQIVSGLDVNSRVIQDPPDSLIEGETVNVIKPGQGTKGHPDAKPDGSAQK